MVWWATSTSDTRKPCWVLKWSLSCSVHSIKYAHCFHFPDSKVRGAYMGPTWGRQGLMLAPWTLLSGPCFAVVITVGVNRFSLNNTCMGWFIYDVLCMAVPDDKLILLQWKWQYMLLRHRMGWTHLPSWVGWCVSYSLPWPWSRISFEFGMHISYFGCILKMKSF